MNRQGRDSSPIRGKWDYIGVKHSHPTDNNTAWQGSVAWIELDGIITVVSYAICATMA